MSFAGKFCVAKTTVRKIKLQACSEFTTQISSSVRITMLELAKFLTHTSIHLITLTQFLIRMKHRFQEDYITCSAMRLRTSIFSSSTALSCFRNTAGTGVGLLVLRSLIECFGAGVGVAGMKPFPLQLERKDAAHSRWRRRLRLEQFASDSEISTRKLRNYYHKLGFVRMRSTPFMFRSLSWTLPTIEQLYADVRR